MRHGTITGYRKHLAAKEPACDECRAANNTYHKRYRAMRELGHGPRTVDATGTQRRIQALAALGWPEEWVMAEAGIPRSPAITRRNTTVTQPTAKAIAAAYERLSMRLPPQHTAEQKRAVSRARNLAHKNGWPPPLAWDAIDNPNETPKGIAA